MKNLTSLLLRTIGMKDRKSSFLFSSIHPSIHPAPTQHSTHHRKIRKKYMKKHCQLPPRFFCRQTISKTQQGLCFHERVLWGGEKRNFTEMWQLNWVWKRKNKAREGYLGDEISLCKGTVYPGSCGESRLIIPEVRMQDRFLCKNRGGQSMMGMIWF